MKGAVSMEIRKATEADYIKVVRSVQCKKIAYITPSHVRQDIQNEQQFIMVEGTKLIAMLSLVYDPVHKYYAMKRLCVPNKRNQGKGYAVQMIQYVSSLVDGKVGCTPWVDNLAVRHTLEKLGFKYEYTFDEVWCFYSKENERN